MTPPGSLGILETCLYVDDLPRAESFYCDLLGLEFVSRQEGRHVFLRCGRQMLLLFNAENTQDETSDFPAHGAVGPGHAAFAIRQDQLATWRNYLQQHEVDIEREITYPNNTVSLYFRDPSGNSLELASPQLWNFPEAS